MASIKELKKSISGLTYEVVSDCFTYLLVNDEKDRDKVLKIISDTIKNRNDLIDRVNHSAGEGNKKKYFNKIGEDLVSKMDHSFNQLSKLSAK